MTCFGLWRLKIKGVTCNDEFFWHGEGEGVDTIFIKTFLMGLFLVNIPSAKKGVSNQKVVLES